MSRGFRAHSRHIKEINDPPKSEESPSFPRSSVGMPSPTLRVVWPSQAEDAESVPDCIPTGDRYALPTSGGLARCPARVIGASA
ncbi:hypothetical protein SAMN05444166_3343 [Singulisphaera sp. GP187]|nr:hypothetical protein SAMN05444166_3343 [Singulisphaera sp. GP187]